MGLGSALNYQSVSSIKTITYRVRGRVVGACAMMRSRQVSILGTRRPTSCYDYDPQATSTAVTSMPSIRQTSVRHKVSHKLQYYTLNGVKMKMPGQAHTANWV